jgi:hypothetical protein
VRFLASSRDRWQPLQSPARRLRVYPACTAGSDPVWSRTPSVPPRPGTDRSTGHGKADAGIEEKQQATCPARLWSWPRILPSAVIGTRLRDSGSNFTGG